MIIFLLVGPSAEVDRGSLALRAGSFKTAQMRKPKAQCCMNVLSTATGPEVRSKPKTAKCYAPQ
jgi:hypothetical protein